MNSVTFYIPCFNAAKTLSACLDSVLSQTYSAQEVLVVDDGSQDETVQVAGRYPVRLIRHGENRGLAAARNSAIKEARGEYIASVDSDCVCDKDWLRHLMDHFASPDIAGAGGKLLEFRDKLPADLWRAVHMKQHWGAARAQPPFLFGANTVFRRDALIQAGLYDETFRNNYEDVDLCARLKKAGYTLVYEPNAVAHHLREDSPDVLLDTYWQWYLAYSRQELFFSSAEKFRFKIKDNLGTANRYLEEDLVAGRPSLFYLDFLLAFHHSLRDLEAFMEPRSAGEKDEATPLSLWLAFVDLVFFCRFDSKEAHIRSFVKSSSSLAQHCFALALTLGPYLDEKFPSGNFSKILFRHLIRALFRIDDQALSDKIFEVVRKHPDWNCLLEKSHPHLDKVFMDAFFLNFKTYTEHLISRFPDVVRGAEMSAQATF